MDDAGPNPAPAPAPAASPKPAGRRRSRDLRNLLLLTLPFAIAATILLALAESWDSDYWQALDFALFAFGAAALWAAAIAGYLSWILFRDGLAGAGIPAFLVLATLACAGAVWESAGYDRTARCHAATAFYDALAALPQAARAAAVGRAGALPGNPSPCALEALVLRFGTDPLPLQAAAAPPSAEERQAVLAQLLAAGLPPDDRMLHAFAVGEADPAATGLIVAQRRSLNAAGAQWDLFPDRIVQALLRHADPCAVTEAGRGGHRDTLRALAEAARPRMAELPPDLQRQLACLDGPPG